MRIHKRGVSPRREFAVLALEHLRHDGLEDGDRGGEIVQLHEDVREEGAGFPEAGEEAGAVGEAGGADGDAEALVRVAAGGQDARFDVEEFDVRDDVGVFFGSGFGEGFDKVEGTRVGLFAYVQVDFEEGAGEGEFGVWRALAAELGEEV